MLIWDILRGAIRSLVAKRTRTMLTMLGIIVGVGSVIVMLAYGEGQKRELLSRFEGWSERLITVQFAYYSWRGNLTVPYSVSLTMDDVYAVRDECSAVSNAVPEAMARLTVRHGTITDEQQAVIATDPGYFEITGNQLEMGEFFTIEDDQQMARVCVLGSRAKESFFETIDVVGQYINISGRRYRVVGVLRSLGHGWLDRLIYIPWRTGTERTSDFPKLGEINVQTVSPDQTQRAKRQVRELLHTRHPSVPVPEDINDDEMSPIFMRSIQSWVSEREQTADSFSLLLKIIGGLSLLIGGVGVMNIMLVTVHERTPEIGLRKALGARRRDIMAQFLSESVIICMAGGSIGMFVAFTACRYLERLPADAGIPDPVITSWAIIIAVAVTVGTGLFFGVYPALQAAKLNPIEALHEGR